MKVVKTATDLRAACDAWRNAGDSISLVPTMGYLHEGHLALMRHGAKIAPRVVATIFVNPTQFGPNEDLSSYPRDTKGDLAKCEQLGVDAVFLPSAEEMYPSGFQTSVHVADVTKGLCGEKRPGHFDGVATVVAKLFAMVGPCSAVFGEKDFQQLQVIRRMTTDLNLPVAVVGHPIVRESDGLAMSSRNKYLSASQRDQATCLYRALTAIHEHVQENTIVSSRDAERLAMRVIGNQPDASIDYVAFRKTSDFSEAIELGSVETVVALAVYFGKTRLIDNLRIPATD